MRSTLWILSLPLFSFASTGLGQAPFVTLSLVPVGGEVVEAGSVVAIEAFITVDGDSCPGPETGTNPIGVRFEGGQIDLPCVLPGGTSGTISIVDPGGPGGGTSDSDGDGLRGPSTLGVPFLFGPSGIGPYSPVNCRIAVVPGIGASPSNIAIGQTRYLGTFFYQVSECAAGDFNALFEGVTVPPIATNATRFRDDCPSQAGQGQLLHLNTIEVTLNVPGGRCCLESTCLGELNEHCCLNVQDGTSWTPGEHCPNGCSCDEPEDCDDGDPCTSELCELGACTYFAVPGACDDGLFCTVEDSCVEGKCQAQPNSCGGLLCNEELDACVQCLTHGDCPTDENTCTDDICTPEGNCVHIIDDSNACDDGLFCSRTDRCLNGICIENTARVCPSGRVCCEDSDVCLACCPGEQCEGALLTSSVPPCDASLWRSKGNLIRLNFAESVVLPHVGDVIIAELLADGEIGPNLNSPGTFSMEMAQGGTQLVIRELGSTLVHRKWYGIRNSGAWQGVAPFQTVLLLQVGDVTGDGRVLAVDAAAVNAAIPCAHCPGDRRDINGDNRILAVDVSIVNSKIPSAPVTKPSGHICRP